MPKLKYAVLAWNYVSYDYVRCFPFLSNYQYFEVYKCPKMSFQYFGKLVFARDRDPNVLTLTEDDDVATAKDFSAA